MDNKTVFWPDRASCQHRHIRKRNLVGENSAVGVDVRSATRSVLITWHLTIKSRSIIIIVSMDFPQPAVIQRLIGFLLACTFHLVIRSFAIDTLRIHGSSTGYRPSAWSSLYFFVIRSPEFCPARYPDPCVFAITLELFYWNKFKESTHDASSPSSSIQPSMKDEPIVTMSTDRSRTWIDHVKKVTTLVDRAPLTSAGSSLSDWNIESTSNRIGYF